MCPIPYTTVIMLLPSLPGTIIHRLPTRPILPNKETHTTDTIHNVVPYRSKTTEEKFSVGGGRFHRLLWCTGESLNCTSRIELIIKLLLVKCIICLSLRHRTCKLASITPTSSGQRLLLVFLVFLLKPIASLFDLTAHHNTTPYSITTTSTTIYAVPMNNLKHALATMAALNRISI